MEGISYSEDISYSEEAKYYTPKLYTARMRKIHCSTDFYFESVRRQTFYFFRHKDSVDVNKLARKGFIYDRLRDEVKCFSCPTIVRKRDNFEDLQSHKNDPDCIMSIFPLNGCVPHIEAANINPEDSIDWLNAILNEFKRDKVKLSSPNSERNIIFDTQNVVVDEEANFLTYNQRISTFANWFSYLPEHARPKEEKFAKAGFVYTGITDIVICHACKGGLFNVHKMDDPAKDHAKFYSHCPFIINYCQTNKYFVKPTVAVTMELEERKRQYLMFHPMIKNLMFDEYEGEAVPIRQFIEGYVNVNGQFPTDLKSFRQKIDEFLNENADNENADNEDADNEDADNEDADNEDADNEDADNENADNENADNENADNENADNEDANNENANN